MTQKLYEEALADANKVKEVAENNAKAAVLEAVVPRIKMLIEQELMNEDVDSQEDLLLGDDAPIEDAFDDVPADAISMPDEEGKVTLDLDQLCPADDDPAVDAPMFGDPIPVKDEYEMSLSGVDALEAKKITNPSQLIERMKVMSETVRRMINAGRLIRESKGFLDQITRMITRVEDMYDYVQESIEDPAKKESYETNLENFFQALTKLQETTVMSTKKRLNEEETQMSDDLDLDAGGDEGGEEGEITLKLTGLPDDVDLDDVGVDLVSGGDDAADDDDDVDLDIDMDDGADDADIDMEDDQGAQDSQFEVSRLSDDTIVEIDEKMLRREIRKMKALREESMPSCDANGNGQDAASLDDFGGGASEGEPITDVDVETDGAEPLGESDVVEGDYMPEEMDVAEACDDAAMPMESARRRLAIESRIQKRAKARAVALKKEAYKARGTKRQVIIREYKKVARRFNESVKRTKVLAKKINESRSNRASVQRADKAVVKNLRSKLTESNLSNVKLAYANKTLQNESMSKRQKAQVIRKLDEVRTVREAKLVYESAVTAPRQTTLAENRRRQVFGSSSRVTQRSQPKPITEGFETERWSKLAGITR